MGVAGRPCGRRKGPGGALFKAFDDLKLRKLLVNRVCVGLPVGSDQDSSYSGCARPVGGSSFEQ
jgi:hypothetical protein